MTRPLLFTALLLLLGACANNSATVEGRTAMLTGSGDIHESTTEDFDVAIDQLAAPMAMPTSQNDNTPNAPLDVQYGITITNHMNEQVTVKRIAVSTPPGPFVIPVTQRTFAISIAPGASQQVDFRATGNARNTNGGANVPTVLRTRITIETSGGTKRTETFLRRINGAVSIGMS